MSDTNSSGAPLGGPLDAILIYHNVNEGTFHPAFYRERPMCGTEATPGVVRLFSAMHHTTGFATLAEAQEHVRVSMQPHLGVPDRNVVLDPAYPWDGQLGDVILTQNWLAMGPDVTFRDVNIVS